MGWQLIVLLVFGGLILLMTTGMPVALCFMLISVIGAFIFWGGQIGLMQLTASIYRSVASFTLMPLVMFILMGEIMFHSGVAPLMMVALDKWLGRIPGRLSFLAVTGGTLFATMSGSSMASCAMLGTVLVPEMEKRGYKKPMSLGPILGSCGLSIMIPPTNLGVLLGAIAQISIGKLLIAIIVPGFLMAFNYATYIIARCLLQPSLAPAYEMPPVPLSEKLVAGVKYILPLGLIIFLVLGVIFLGIATPTEAGATGVIGTVIVALLHRGLNWEAIKKSLTGTIRLSVMIGMIMAGATAFSQIIAGSGASQGLTEFVTSLPLAPVLIIIGMMVVILILGMFMSTVAIMLITLPIFMPVVNALGFDPVWFAVIYLLNIEMATTTPPFGMSLFVMKGVAPPGTTIGDCMRAALPFLYCDAVAMALIVAFPQIALWLPGLMRG